mgnify:CR=1 FL=1
MASLLGCGMLGKPGAGTLGQVDAGPSVKVGVSTVVIPSERASKWADARCNDGSPFGMNVSMAKPASDLWVIKVGGGFFCDDGLVPCSERKELLTTGPGKKDGALSPMLQIGLHSRDKALNPDFHDANHVVLQYCSSDFWLGEKTKRQKTSGSSKGWYFSGRRNFDAALSVLQEEMGMTDGVARVLIGGHSAGGMGVVGNVPLIQQYLSKSIATDNVKIIVDGVWLPKPANLDESPTWNKWGDLNNGCTKEADKNGTDRNYCHFGEEWYPYLKKSGIPVLIQQSSLDPTAKSVYGFQGFKATKEWRELCRSSFAGVDWLFTGGKPYHTATFDAEFTQGDKGKTFQQVVSRFWRGEEPERVFFDYQ